MKYNKLEYNSLLFLSSISLFLGIGISKILNIAKYDSWISIILGTFIGLLINYIFTKLPNKENKILVYIYSTLILILNLLLITKLISSIYLNRTPTLLIIIPLIILIHYISRMEFNTIVKTSLILFFTYILLYLIPLITLVPKINIDEFRPIFNVNVFNIIKGSIDYVLISTTPFILFSNFKEYYNYKTYILSSISILFIFIIIIGNLGINLAMVYRYPEYMVFKEIRILDFIENIQNILAMLWFFSSFTLSSVCVSNIKRVSNKNIVIITLILIIFILNNVLLNNYIYSEYIIKYYSLILLIIIFIFIISKIAGKRKD